MKIWILAFNLCLPLTSFAKNTHLGTPEQRAQAREWNRTHLSVQANQAWDVLKPFSEIEQSGYVAISGANDYELPGLREAIAKNLPQGVTLIIYVGDASDVSQLKGIYSKYLNADQLKFLLVPMGWGADPIWARDSLPMPVHMKTGYGLVDSIYPQSFEPDSAFAQSLSLPIIQTGQYFRGGNMLVDLDANCFSEDVNETADLTDAVGFMTDYFGCKSVTLLKQQGGIGDIDERIKFLTGREALSDDDGYTRILEGKGYTVHRIPAINSDLESYMNTLIVNDTIFVPQMGISSDQDALAAYQAAGFKPVGVMTKQLADQGAGNIHCVTMNYPLGTFTASPRGQDFVQFASK